MAKKTRFVIIFLVATICVVVNFFWLFNKDWNPRPMIQFNIITSIFLLIMIATALYHRK